MVATLRELMGQCSSNIDTAYAAKYLHKVPAAPAVERMPYIIDKCRDKRVMSLGSSERFDTTLAAVSKTYRAVDRIPQTDNVLLVDLDAEPQRLQEFAGTVDVVICGEILEHLSNPGRLLDAVRTLQVPVVVTAPNAFSTIGFDWLKKSKENVNDEHVAYYSHKTLTTLLERHGFTVLDFAWYGGLPMYAEGLIFYVR